MKIVKQKNFNQFNIENMTLAKVLAVINALTYVQSKGLVNKTGADLINSLNNQLAKLTLNED